MINIVIPAAGEATRLRPLTSNCSKAMVRIHGVPAIEYIIESIYKNRNDIGEIVIVDGKHDDIRAWVKKSKYNNIKCVKQGSLKGPRDAIAKGIGSINHIENELVVWLGDALILDNDLPLGIDFLLTKQVDDHFNWCMWDGKAYYNKPQQTIQGATALVGLYSFKSGHKAKLAFENTDEYDISSALELYGSFKSINTTNWYDIGDISSYHKTCAEFLTFKARAFNDFEYDPKLNTVTKYPSYTNKHSVLAIENEKAWYSGLDSVQKMFTPKLLDDRPGLCLSYESGTLLSDLFLHEDLSNSTIDYLIEKVVLTIKQYFHQVPYYSFTKDFESNAKKIWIDKSVERLEQAGFKDTFYYEIASDCYYKAKPVSCMHGDLHFGNVLYNPYNDSLTFIDPRGQYGDHIGTHGDALYDLCKLSHDLYHGYGAIVNGTKEYPEYVKESFKKIIKKYYHNLYNEIIDGGALLIATCIPLHNDDKQRQERMRDYVKKYVYYRP